MVAPLASIALTLSESLTNAWRYSPSMVKISFTAAAISPSALTMFSEFSTNFSRASALSATGMLELIVNVFASVIAPAYCSAARLAPSSALESSRSLAALTRSSNL